MNAPLEPAHSPFGGSVAARVLTLPGFRRPRREGAGPSAQILGLCGARHGAPCGNGASARRQSASLDEPRRQDVQRLHDHARRRRERFAAGLAYVEPLLDAPGAEFYLEQRVVFPTIAGAFGTADLIVRIGNTIHVVDFKFGAGVRVLALYP